MGASATSAKVEPSLSDRFADRMKMGEAAVALRPRLGHRDRHRHRPPGHPRRPSGPGRLSNVLALTSVAPSPSPPLLSAVTSYTLSSAEPHRLSRPNTRPKPARLPAAYRPRRWATCADVPWHHAESGIGRAKEEDHRLTVTHPVASPLERYRNPGVPQASYFSVPAQSVSPEVASRGHPYHLLNKPSG